MLACTPRHSDASRSRLHAPDDGALLADAPGHDGRARNRRHGELMTTISSTAEAAGTMRLTLTDDGCTYLGDDALESGVFTVEVGKTEYFGAFAVAGSRRGRRSATSRRTSRRRRDVGRDRDASRAARLLLAGGPHRHRGRDDRVPAGRRARRHLRPHVLRRRPADLAGYVATSSSHRLGPLRKG